MKNVSGKINFHSRRSTIAGSESVCLFNEVQYTSLSEIQTGYGTIHTGELDRFEIDLR